MKTNADVQPISHIANDLSAMMEAWEHVEAQAKLFAPNASSEEIYKMTADVMLKQLRLKK